MCSTSKPSLNGDHSDSFDSNSRGFSNKRVGSSHGGRSNPFNNIAPLTTAGIASPTGGASAAFGLGSGAFSSFGSATKTPKTPGTAFNFSQAAAGGSTATTQAADKSTKTVIPTRSSSAAKKTAPSSVDESPKDDRVSPWPLKHTWVIWYRPPTSKNSDYEKSTKAMCKFSTAQDFWRVYSHMKRPSQLPTVSDYHFFKDGIRPVWEDEENKRGGKWIIRLKKGVSDRYWEDLLMAIVGDQFAEASEEVSGAVLSVRSGEDVFSIWTKNDGGRNIKIRETVKRVLSLPADTNIVWKSHDDSIAQRSALDQARVEKTHHEKRRVTLTSDDANSIAEKVKAIS
jgi:translation initiation factor 4E